MDLQKTERTPSLALPTGGRVNVVGLVGSSHNLAVTLGDF